MLRTQDRIYVCVIVSGHPPEVGKNIMSKILESVYYAILTD